uniref:Amino acid transporter transmembrane domain-containing protein n=1 Tax=Physcomitrium patens TaxID=3218 RepID=A0A2K1JZ51_PHYPA|nr:hypothetical protein PHYPA_013919 [Physcomitrium patens]
MRARGPLLAMVYLFMVLSTLFTPEVLATATFVCEERGGYSVDFSWHSDRFLGLQQGCHLWVIGVIIYAFYPVFFLVSLDPGVLVFAKGFARVTAL